VNALNRVGCSSVTSENFVEVMRQLGGYSNVIEKAADDTFTKLNANPRFARTSRDVIENFTTAAPTLREQLQILASKLRLASSPIGSKPELKGRATLQDGTYTEIELIVPKHKWHGFADILTLSRSRCEIVDFKTGDPSPAHEDQIHIYSLLWALDHELNPSGRLADTLTLSYSTGDVSVRPLSHSELIDLEKTLVSRTTDALAAVQGVPPRATPSIENCTFCAVRQLCDDYWTEVTQKTLAKETPSAAAAPSGPNWVGDIEVEIAEQESPSIWKTNIISSRSLCSGSTVLVRIPQENQSFGKLLKPGRRLRIIDALFISRRDDESAAPLVNIVMSCEMFIV
jgi:hypothetical protein